MNTPWQWLQCDSQHNPESRWPAGPGYSLLGLAVITRTLIWNYDYAFIYSEAKKLFLCCRLDLQSQLSWHTSTCSVISPTAVIFRNCSPSNCNVCNYTVTDWGRHSGWLWQSRGAPMMSTLDSLCTLCLQTDCTIECPVILRTGFTESWLAKTLFCW